MRWILMVVIAGCGSSQAPTAAPADRVERVAPPTVIEEEADAGFADAGAAPETAEADGGPQPSRSRTSGPARDEPVEPGCDEESERQCQMRGGNCRLVLDSPCVGRGSRCQDFELEQASGCRCYCQPVDAAGRPVLPR